MRVSPRSVSTSGSGLWLLGKGAPDGEGAPLWERARPFGGGHVHFDLVGEKGRAPVAEGAPLWERALSKCHIENLTY